ncbi:hypothetical protein SELMODRAFT_431284 [Selaginella moellendorffii]|uniref:Uncharacterized protein n=1 Tax=Selaginella moellendorffii TaxID=88036 RepID=D8TC43_SELML|nr:uncharacterized protein LOC9652667 [Selaginella moellendorffii]EFJ05810.1 hypothetical protein SELMODRAFT_431284 [Selaginella moellendorffii]|eukprot:XP_002993170.1 uncharacterized protein LOC9652667 [Selaginella moellendorffii]
MGWGWDAAKFLAKSLLVSMLAGMVIKFSFEGPVTRMIEGPITRMIEGPVDRTITGMIEGPINRMITGIIEGPINRMITGTIQGPVTELVYGPIRETAAQILWAWLPAAWFAQMFPRIAKVPRSGEPAPTGNDAHRSKPKLLLPELGKGKEVPSRTSQAFMRVPCSRMCTARAAESSHSP